MKKTMKKRLLLNRETLVNLDHSLKQAAGGATAVTQCGSQSCPVICTFSANGDNTCVTCAGTCTTNNC
ncbi:MAG TPA: hypothetical protein VIE43_15770 [Thermoanaerobaculia bacterium]|jgi:hypothetical protein|nr:hypothetical protein [Thermoanaerobaculia bacterium]